MYVLGHIQMHVFVKSQKCLNEMVCFIVKLDPSEMCLSLIFGDALLLLQ